MAAGGAGGGELHVVLDAFGHHGEAEAAGGGDHAFHHDAFAFVPRQALCKTTIKLDRVHRQAGKAGEAGITGAEIIQRDAHPVAAQEGEGGGGGVEIVDDGFFGDLDHQPVRR